MTRVQRTSSETDFASMIGKRVEFFGVDNLTLCIRAPGNQRKAFEAIEDGRDGYRSMLQELKAVLLDGLIFFRSPITHLTVRKTDQTSEFDGYELVADDGHIWLQLGTDYSDDYYPQFTFRYDPPKGSVCEMGHEDCREHHELGAECALAERETRP